MPFTPPSSRLRISDPTALRALAHPLRLALLDHLMAFGERTAAQCADAVGSTASNCSYHLRALARVGLVERGSSDDRRERPWRTTATGVDFGPADAAGSPAARQAALAVEQLSLSGDDALTHRALARHPEQPPEWQAAETYHNYALRVTAAELSELVAAIDGLIRPFIAPERGQAPDGTDIAALRVLAFRHPDAP